MSSGSEQRQRQAALRVRLTEGEQAQLAAAAERAGLTLAGYARSVLLAAPPLRQSRRPPVERAELSRLLAQLGKIGSNVNQLARAANTAAEVAEADLRAAAADLAILRTAIMAALGREP
jgi:hypothetical protein